MFSSLASLFKNKKKSKNDCGNISRKNSEISVGKDVLEVLGSRYVESGQPQGCSVDLVECGSKSGAEKDSPIVMRERLLKGSSDSKPQDPSSTPTSGNDKTRLYPDLDSVSNGAEVGKKVVVGVEEEIKSIHDIVAEIHCVIVPKILNAVERKRNLEILKRDVSSKIMALQNAIINPTKYDYDFKKEYEVADNSESKYFIKIENFEKLKIFCQNIDKKLLSFSDDSESKRKSPKKQIFQYYSKSFKSYRGDERDVVNCP